MTRYKFAIELENRCKQLEAERDRYREALKKIANAKLPVLDDGPIARTLQLGGLWAGLVIVAKEVLSKPGDPK